MLKFIAFVLLSSFLFWVIPFLVMVALGVIAATPAAVVIPWIVNPWGVLVVLVLSVWMSYKALY